MDKKIFAGILIPFLGTTLGSAMVFFMKDKLKESIQRGLSGFAAGVMVAASIRSLIIPAMEMWADRGKLKVLPVVIGFMVGIFFLLFLDDTVPHQHVDSDVPEGKHKNRYTKTTMLVLAVTIHNIPEGMAVGAQMAGYKYGNAGISFSQALVLSIGIAIQNFPEGAIISMPLRSEGLSKKKAFNYGTLSGAVEPVAALLTLFLSSIMVPIMPYLLSFAAGAMFYVVVEELVPEATGTGESHTNSGTLGFAAGFCLMMVLDVVLG